MSVDLVLEDHVALITLNRPEKLNAMDAEHYAALSDAWTRVRDDKDVRVAVVTGAGERAFSVGADLKSFVRKPPELTELMNSQKSQLLNRGLEVWKPVVSAINGICLGGGTTLMLATDVRVAADHATFGLSEVKRGILAGNGGTQRILKQVPYCVGMEMLLTGDAISAGTAERWGLVNQVLPAVEVLPAAMEIAGRIASNAPLAVQATKELACRSFDMDLAAGLRMEQAMLRLLQDTDDTTEGLKAFSEKREPRFTAS